MAKKAVSFITSIIMLLICITVPVSAADPGTGMYRVTSSDGVKAYSEPVASDDWVTTVRRDACVNVIATEGSFGKIVYDSIYCWIDITSGVQFIRSDPYVDSSGKVDGLIDIRVKSLPTKTEYIDSEEEFDVDGLVVSAVFSDGTELEVEGYSVAVPSLTSPGRKAVLVYYGGLSASFFITVSRAPLSGIKIVSLPDKTDYLEGETISFDGLKVQAEYSDGRAPTDITDYKIKGIDTSVPAVPGRYTVTITYKYSDITAEFTVNVASRSLKSLKIKSMPTSLFVYVGQELDLSGVVLVAQYDNGETVETSDFDAEYDTSTPGAKTAKLYYDGRFVAFDFTVLESKEVSMEIIPPEDSYSFLDDKPDFSALQVFITYESGEKLQISDYEIECDADGSQTGSYRVTVKHGDFTAVFEHNVYKKYLGDVDFNGKVTPADARKILRCAARLESLSAAARAVADINGDGKISPNDARIALRIAARLEKHPDDIQGEEVSQPAGDNNGGGKTEDSSLPSSEQ